MRKIGYFFYSFLPIILAIGIQFAATFFLMGTCIIISPSNSMTNLLMHVTDSNFATGIMVIYSLMCTFCFGMWYYLQFEGDLYVTEFKKLNIFIIIGIILLVPASQFLSSYICTGIQFLNPHWWESYEKLVETTGMGDNKSTLMLIYSVILAPICEELIFRGVTMRSFKRVAPFWYANVFQAVLFGFFHMNWVQGIYAFTIGLILGYVCEKGGSIYCSILMHFLFNFYGTVLSKYLGFLDSTIALIILIPITILLLIAGLFLYRKGIQKNTSKSNKACIL